MGEQQFTGEIVTLDAYNMSQSVGRKCNIQIAVGDRVFSRAAVAQMGEDISWMALLSLDPYNREETMYHEMSLEPEQTTSSVEVEAEGAHEGGIADSGLTRN